MKLLVDEMFSPELSIRLLVAGFDAVGVVERDDLREMTDRELFNFAQRDGRAIVTEDLQGFLPLGREAIAIGVAHFGLVLTTGRGYPRARGDTIPRIVAAIVALDAAEPGEWEPSSREIWL